MAKLSKQEIEEIVERDMPGYKVVEHQEGVDKPVAPPDEVAPDIDTLREKYLGESEDTGGEDNPGNERAVGTRGENSNAEDDDPEDAIVAVQPTQTSDPFDHAARPKTVVVSGKDRRVVGSQG